jgi:hypothetical protein
VQGVKVWWDGKEFTPQAYKAAAGTGADGPSNEVLLPYAREDGITALVVSAQLCDADAAAAGGKKNCVVLFKGFRWVSSLELCSRPADLDHTKGPPLTTSAS